jgi:hypothetical protein
MMPIKLNSTSIVKGVLDTQKNRMITCPKNCGMSSLMTLMKNITIKKHPTLQFEFTRFVDDFATRKVRNKMNRVTHNER